MPEPLDEDPLNSERPDLEPSASHPLNFYWVLNLSPQATLSEIKRAFRRLARQYHPDLNPNDAHAAERFEQIYAAYAVLSNHQRRAQYDESLSSSIPQEPEPEDVQIAYQQGLDLLALRDYVGAITAFDKAIQINSEFVDAYLGRCKANEALKDNQAILADCYQLLQISPQLAQAYYYQGRARFRLGYVQGALEAYTHAITLQQTFALAYYQRGRILIEQNDTEHACQDLQRASQLFRVQDDLEHYRQTESLLNRYASQSPARFQIQNGLPRFLTSALSNLPALLLNPSTNLQAIFTRLGPTRAVWTGLFYGLLVAGCTVIAGTLQGGAVGQNSLNLALAVGRFYGTLVVTGVFVQKVAKGRFHWSQSCFLAGLAAIPIGGWALLSTMSLGLRWIWPMLTLLTGGYSAICLYIGYTQLGKVSESTAIAVTPLMLIISVTVAIAFLS